MTATMNLQDYQVKLLGTLDFEEVLRNVAGLFQEQLAVESAALLIWDPDLEAFLPPRFFGQECRRLEEHAGVLVSSAPREVRLLAELPRNVQVSQDGASSVDQAEPCFKESAPNGLASCYVIAIENENRLCALLLAATRQPLSEPEVERLLGDYPVALALANGWEVRELKLENLRLRNQYDASEDRNLELEEQLRKLSQSIQVKDALRYKTLEREKLVYQISNAIRSSVEIQAVLETAVRDLAQRIGLSRAIIFRPTPSDSLFVYEYNDPQVASARHQLFTPEGRAFVRAAMNKSAPCDLAGPDDAVRMGFSPEFMGSFGYLSALLIPLLMRNKTVGCIFLQDCKTARPWSIDDLTFFGALADQLSVAVENADLHELKKLQAVTDPLTGIANRRNFTEVFAREFERAKRYQSPLSLAVIDLDYLKKINDTYGHTAGDDAIKAIAKVLSGSSRSIDLAARYGGEEFCLLLPNTNLDEAVLIAERIRGLISELELPGGLQISASIGVANFPLHASEPDDLFSRADEAMYAAKQGGRNRVCVTDGTPSHS